VVFGDRVSRTARVEPCLTSSPSRSVGGARLLTGTGGGHTSFLNLSTCVNDAIDVFSASGALPPPGTVWA
jgi:hypothetical protein